MADPSIPLSFRPAQIQQPDIVGAVQQGMNLRAMAQAQQINQARLQEEQMRAQQMAEDRRDWQTIQSAYQQYPGDMQKVRQTVAGQINLRNLQAFDRSEQEHSAAMARMTQDQIAVRRDQNEQLARHLDAVANVRRGDDSPEAVAARAAEYAKQVTLARSQNLDAQGQLPAQYPGDAALPVWDSLLRGEKAHLDQEEARRKGQESALSVQQKGQQVAAGAREEAAGRLAAAAQQGAGAYITQRAAIEQQNPSLKGVFTDVPQDAQPVGAMDDEFVKNIQNIGMNPREQATIALTERQRETQAQAAEAMASYREQMANVASDKAATYGVLAGVRQQLADIAQQRADQSGAGGGQTANSRAVDQRNARREYDKLRLEENKLNRLRISLGPLLFKEKHGQQLVNQKGDNKGEPRNIQDEFDQTTDELEMVMRDKYDAAQRAGMGTPSVSLEDAVKAMRQGGAPSQSAAGSTPPPTAPSATPPPVGKPTAAPKPAAATGSLPPAIAQQLKADKVTKLSDGTAWALVNGKPTKMQKTGNSWTPVE